MKEVARAAGGRALVIDAVRVPGATVGQVLKHNGTEFVPGAEDGGGIPAPTAPDDGALLIYDAAAPAWDALPPGTAGQGLGVSAAGQLAWLDTLPLFIALCLYATTDLSSATACGRCRVDPADLARGGGLTAALELEVIGDVSASGPSGSVELYDLTAAASVATITFTETSPTRKTASVVLPGAAHLYELRVSLSGGSGPGDYLTIGGAQLRVTWS